MQVLVEVLAEVKVKPTNPETRTHFAMNSGFRKAKASSTFCGGTHMTSAPLEAPVAVTIDVSTIALNLKAGVF